MKELGTVREFISRNDWEITWNRAFPFIIDRSPIGRTSKFELLDNITVGISDKIKTSAGYAHRGSKGNKILLHPILFDKEAMAKANPHDSWQLKETFFHELAHHVATVIWGRNINPHGNEWWMAMAWFNFIPSRCHDLSTAQLSSYRERKLEVEAQNILEDF